MQGCKSEESKAIGYFLEQEISQSKSLQWSTFGSIASIAVFNFFGISVTKQLSGAGRATIDASRTVFVWMLSLWIGWESFHGLEVGSLCGAYKWIA